MLAGLRKGTETIKLRAENNFINFLCPICDKIILIKPYDNRSTCSIECGIIFNQENATKALVLANEKNLEKFNEISDKRKLKIIEWVNLNKDKFTNIKFNNLSFLQELSEYLDVKDIRTVMKVFKITSKKVFIEELKKYLN